MYIYMYMISHHILGNMVIFLIFFFNVYTQCHLNYPIFLYNVHTQCHLPNFLYNVHTKCQYTFCDIVYVPKLLKNVYIFPTTSLD